jgi:hypothetical protein
MYTFSVLFHFRHFGNEKALGHGTLAAVLFPFVTTELKGDSDPPPPAG